MRPLFNRLPRPYICTILTDATPDAAIASIREAEYEGTAAFAIMLKSLRPEFHTLEHLRRIFLATALPFMAIPYRKNIRFDTEAEMNAHWTMAEDEAIAEEILTCVRAGASCVDVTADLFAPDIRQLTEQPEAVARQRRLIGQVHALGAEALLSAHVWMPMDAGEVLHHMRAMATRGADIAKVAHWVDSPTAQAAAFATTEMLSREMPIPFLHICLGPFGKLHRFVGPMLGSTLIFTVPHFTVESHKEQPPVRAAKAVLDNLDYRIPRSAWGEEA